MDDQNGPRPTFIMYKDFITQVNYDISFFVPFTWEVL